jgi:hypothetical protein
MKRLIPNIPFPPYLFIPGVNTHPKKEGGHMFEQGEPVASALDVAHTKDSDFLKYSIDLFNHGYYWESHVYFEALWNAHGRKGSVADFLKAMIKLGAAGVKFSIQQDENAKEHLIRAKEHLIRAKEHLIRAKELLSSVIASEGRIFLGFDLSDIIKKIDLAEKLPFIGFAGEVP